MTKVEKVIMALLTIMIILFISLLATDNVQILIIVGDKIKTGAEKIDWKEALKMSFSRRTGSINPPEGRTLMRRKKR